MQTFYLSLGNYVDGDTLVALPNDFDEFTLLVPQSGLRMKLKCLIRKYQDSNSVGLKFI